MGQDDKLMTVTETVEDTGVSRAFWQKLVASGRTPPVMKFGAVQRIRRSA